MSEVSGCSVAAAKCYQGQAGIVKLKLLPQPPKEFTPVLFCQVQHLQYWSFLFVLENL